MIYEYFPVEKDIRRREMLRKYVFFGIFTVVMVTILNGCSFYFQKPFVDPGLSGDKVTAGGLAVFPFIMGDAVVTASGIEAYCRSAGQEMTDRIRKKQPNVKVLSPAEVSSMLNNADLVSDYSKMAEDYKKVGILNTNIAGKIADALGVKYFIINNLHSLYNEVGKKEAIAILTTQIWSAEENHMVFECTKKQSASGILSAPFEKAVRFAALSSTATLTSKVWKK